MIKNQVMKQREKARDSFTVERYLYLIFMERFQTLFPTTFRFPTFFIKLTCQRCHIVYQTKQQQHPLNDIAGFSSFYFKIHAYSFPYLLLT